MAKTTKKDEKIVDVAKPGASAPDTSARPVIVGHRTLLQDPMVTPAQKDEDKGEEVVVSKTAPTLKPLSEVKTAEQPAAKPAEAKETKADKTEEKAATTEEAPAYVIERVKSKLDEPEKEDTPPEPEKPAPAAKPEEKPTPSESSESEKPAETEPEENAPEATAEQEQAAAKKVTDKEDKEALARQEAAQKLITDKTYYLSIGEAKRKRNMSLVVLLVLLIVVAAVAYLAIDADIIRTSLNLPVQFFK